MLKLPKLFRFLLPLSAVVLAATGLTSVAQAQGADEAIEEIITTGTRRAERTASDSSVPIDVITGQEFVNMGTGDMDEMLKNTLPSYNVQRFGISDAATLGRPATTVSTTVESPERTTMRDSALSAGILHTTGPPRATTHSTGRGSAAETT